MNDQVVDYYDSIAESYDESRFGNSYGRFIDSQERRVLNRLIDRSCASEQRLEMACGTGRLTGYATHALDASSKMMAHARKLHPGVEFRETSAAETGFDTAQFDVVYTFHLLMHLDEATVKQIVDEAHRILKPGGRFIFDLPSSKRRKLLHHKQESWHGGTQMSSSDVKAMAQGKFTLNRRHGIMMLPVHKLPRCMRKPLTGIDYALAGSFLKEYSSYIIYELVKL